MKRRAFLGSLAPLTLPALPALADGGAAAATAASSPAAAAGASAATGALPAVAFYYGAQIPFDELRAFDWVVLEPEHALAADPAVVARLAPEVLAIAYVSLGEVQSRRPYAAALPPGAVAARNAEWDSLVIDQTAPGWAAFVAERLIAPLWQAGFRAFFLDTLDAWHRIATNDAERSRQAQALRATLAALQQRFDGIRFVFNRGFELVDAALAPALLAVAAESLFERWDPASRGYGSVPEADRAWLLARFAELRTRFGVPGLAIDYCPVQNRALARQTAARIAEAGLIPWVAEPSLMSLGVGTLELVPRRVLLLHSTPEGNAPDLQADGAHMYGALPIEYHGLVPVYRYMGDASPIEGALAGRYAAVVLWSERSEVPEAARALLRRARDEGVPCLILGQSEPGLLREFGLQPGADALPGPIRVQRAAATPVGEALPLVAPTDTVELSAGADAEVWLAAHGRDGRRMDGAAITRWGGYALGNFGVFDLPGDTGTRWAIDPIEFFRRALRVGDAPMPDVTTRTGRRAFFVHFDSDGWVNRCDRPGAPLVGEVLVREYIEVYRTPVLGSAIVAEIAKDGVYPETAEAGQRWAKRLFALPWVEAASHSWSHPFDWVVAAGEQSRRRPYNPLKYGAYLRVPGYTFSTETEVAGSKRWIEQHLLPPGKVCRMFLWPGDCNPPASAVAAVVAAGMGNINGGGATITRSDNTLCNVWPLGIPKGAHEQVYAPMSNEQDYTNNWTGPFFGFERAIETFELTDQPRRLKPINLYFHPYVVANTAGANSLHKLWRWALAQPVHPIYASQYVASVEAWRRAVVARRLEGGWRLRADPALRQWQQPLAAAAPDLARSTALAGYTAHGPRRYLHLSASTATLIPAGAGSSASAVPRLVDANADLVRWTREARRLQMGFEGHVPLELRLELPPGWQLVATPRSAWRVARQPQADGRVLLQLSSADSRGLVELEAAAG